MTNKRITIPEGHVALILPEQLSFELLSLLQTIRRGRRVIWGENSAPLKAVAGDVVLALLDAREEVGR